MPVCSIVKTITPRCRGRPDALLHEAEGRVQYCIRLSTVPRGNTFDYTTNRHEICGYYPTNLMKYLAAFLEDGVAVDDVVLLQT